MRRKEHSKSKEQPPPVTHTVTFNRAGGTGSTPTRTVTAGQRVASPKAPTRTGFTFAGWFRGTTRWNFNNPVTANLTLTARWTPRTITLTFDAGQGRIGRNRRAAVRNTFGSRIRLARNPTRAGFVFRGWFTRKSGGRAVTNRTAVPAGSATFHARWARRR